MSEVKIAFRYKPTIAQLEAALETTKGQEALYAFEHDFVSVADLLGHTSNAPHGSLVHVSPGETVLFENVPKHEFATFAHDVASVLGLNP